MKFFGPKNNEVRSFWDQKTTKYNFFGPKNSKTQSFLDQKKRQGKNFVFLDQKRTR